MKKHLWLMAIGCGVAFCAFAGVYQCLGANGQIEFRDYPCQSSLDTEHFLPYVYEGTDEKKRIKEEKALKKRHQQLQKAEKRHMQAQAREQKAEEKKALQSKRYALRCNAAQEKIKLIEKKLKFGCKIRRCDSLKQQLAQYELMKQKYCSP